MADVDGRPVGQLIRAVRVYKRWRQEDLAAAAGVSQKQVSRSEAGRLEEVSLDTLERIAGAVDVTITLVGRHKGGLGDRLLDREHAAIVQEVAAVLVGLGWAIVPEYTFNHFGDRGSVDLVAWHEESATLLLVEVKSRLNDLQDLFSRFATKLRIVPKLLAEERGWQPRAIGRVVVLPGTSPNRSIVARHRDLFDASYPMRAVHIRKWMRDPTGPVAGVWFIAPRRVASANRPRRVRTSRPT